MPFNASEFGKDFKWGVSSSAYQSEGAYVEDGKGLSIWDVFCSKPGKIHLDQNANVSCDFYNHFIQDTILMNYLNIRNFRFSISWPRIFPEGVGNVNQKGIDFYDRLIDTCLEQDIEPWVTLYHWDLPQALEDKGGWTNRSVVYWFSNYVEMCLKKFSDRVKHWMVLNEPFAFTGAGYFLGIHAPGKKGLHNFLQAMHHAALCQGIGGKLIKSHSKKLQVGTTFSMSHIDPADNTVKASEAAIRVDALVNRLFIEPLLGYGYPWDDLKIIRAVEKYMISGDEELLKCNMDFIGLQNYTREVVQYNPLIPYINAKLIKASRRKVPHSAMDWEIYPEGIYHCLKKISRYKNVKKIIITENGAAFDDQVIDGMVQDQDRIDFYTSYLEQVLRAKKEGIKVDGFFAWSFTDNFEWAEGYSKRFGLVYVDYPTQKRIIKSSGFWYKNFLKHLDVVADKDASIPAII